MANSRLKVIVSFDDIPPGATASLPHNLNRNGHALIPDIAFSDNGAVEVQEAPATDEFNVTVKNTSATEQSARVLCEYWHSENRSQGFGMPGAASGDAIEPSPPFIPSGGALPTGNQGWRVRGPVIADPAPVAPDDLIKADPSGGGFSITLPALTAADAGASVAVKNVTTSVNPITVTSSGADTIDSAAAFPITSSYGASVFVWDGAGNWDVI